MKIKIELHLNFCGTLIVEKDQDSNYATAELKGFGRFNHLYQFRTTATNESDLRNDALLFVKKEVEKNS